MDAIVAVYQDWGIGARGNSAGGPLCRPAVLPGENPERLGHRGAEHPGGLPRRPPPCPTG